MRSPKIISEHEIEKQNFRDEPVPPASQCCFHVMLCYIQFGYGHSVQKQFSHTLL